MILNKDEEHANSMTPTLSTLRDQRKFYEMLETPKFKWLSKAYEFNTGLDPLNIYRNICWTTQLRILANIFYTTLIIGFWFFIYEESLRSNWLIVKDFPFFTIGCILSLVIHWVLESKALDALVAVEWKTHTFLNEVYEIIPEGHSYKDGLFFEALTGTVCEIHREDPPKVLKKSHSERLIKKALGVIDQEGTGKKDAFDAVKRDAMKAELRKLHTIGKKFSLYVSQQNEDIDCIYRTAKASRV
ncbi:hypothetical protein EB052_00800 [bacterium]|nr:hypothetical protein [bacterium]